MLYDTGFHTDLAGERKQLWPCCSSLPPRYSTGTFPLEFGGWRDPAVVVISHIYTTLCVFLSSRISKRKGMLEHCPGNHDHRQSALSRNSSKSGLHLIGLFLLASLQERTVIGSLKHGFFSALLRHTVLSVQLLGTSWIKRAYPNHIKQNSLVVLVALLGTATSGMPSSTLW